MTTKFSDSAAAFHRAAHLLRNRRDMAIAEGARLYDLHGSQRAMGLVDGYDLALRYIVEAEGAQREMALKATAKEGE